MNRGLPAILLLWSGVAGAAVEGEGVTKSRRAVRAERPPKIDGHFDDPVWAHAPSDDHFTQQFPDEGKPPTERTEFRVAYDDDNLYVAVSCFDSRADKLAARLTRRDRDIEADWLALYIDSRHDHSSGLIFQLSAAQVQVDGELFNDTGYSPDWDAVWNGAVAHDAKGWYAEFAIPLTVLRFSNAADQTWGFQVHRNVSRKREQSLWTYIPSNVQGLVSRFGHLEGIHGIHPRRTFELRPYASAKVRARSAEGGALFGTSLGGTAESSADVGLDLKLGLTSRLTLDATVNPDFGQVEADQVVLNLTRFETFFPEKRPFFLEGREVFETPITVFYPRRIGQPAVGLGPGTPVRDENGMPAIISDAEGAVPIWAAAKVSGSVGGRVGLGVMGALTGAESVDIVDEAGQVRELDLTPRRSYAVLRSKLSLGENSYLGVIGTAMNRLGGDVYFAQANHDAYAEGLDGRITSQNGKWRFTGQLVASQRAGGTDYQDAEGRPCTDPEACLPVTRQDGTRMGPGAVGYGALAQLNYSDQKYGVEARYQGLSPKLDINAAGFLPQFNQHELQLFTSWAHRKPEGPFLRWFLYPVAYARTSWDGVPQQLQLGLDSEFLFKRFIFTSPQLFVTFPGGYDDFETLDGAHFERPANLDANWVVNSNPANPISGEIRLFARKDLGGGGWFLGANSFVNWQALSNLELRLEPQVGWEENALRFQACATESGRACIVEPGRRRYTFADLDSRFVSLTFRGIYTFIPTLSVQAYAQLFMATGEFANPRTIDTEGDEPYIHRDDLVPVEGGETGGFDGASLNINLVLRWEVLPGSTLFGVFTRVQEAPHFSPAKLSQGPTEDVFLLKLVYYVS